MNIDLRCEVWVLNENKKYAKYQKQKMLSNYYGLWTGKTLTLRENAN